LRNGARKQHVLFQMDVLVQVLLKLLQTVIECVVSRARAHRRCEAVAQALNLGQMRPGGIVFAGHHGNAEEIRASLKSNWEIETTSRSPPAGWWSVGRHGEVLRQRRGHGVDVVACLGGMNRASARRKHRCRGSSHRADRGCGGGKGDRQAGAGRGR